MTTRTRAAKQKGTTAETQVAAFLQECFSDFDIDRQVKTGAKDKGDIRGLPIAIEVKNEKRITLSSYVDEANVEAVNAKKILGVAIVKRPRQGHPRNWYAVMDVDSLILLLGYAMVPDTAITYKEPKSE